MEAFTLDPRCWRIGYIFGRNPLIRRADRIEALVSLLALAVLLVPAKVGERVEILVDDDGNQLAPPTPTWHAVGDAVGTAVAMLLVVVVGETSVVTGVRSRLDRARDVQWERALKCLEDDGGRTSQR